MGREPCVTGGSDVIAGSLQGKEGSRRASHGGDMSLETGSSLEGPAAKTEEGAVSDSR